MLYPAELLPQLSSHYQIGDFFLQPRSALFSVRFEQFSTFVAYALHFRTVPVVKDQYAIPVHNMGMGTFFSIRLPAFNRVNLALLVGSLSLHPIVAKSFFPDDFIVMLPTVCSFGEKEKDKEGNEKKDSGEL